MGWQRLSGCNWHALVEAELGRYKRVIGNALRAHTEARSAIEVRITVQMLNHILKLGRPEYLRIA